MIHTKKLAILVGLLFLVTPLAGCVGGGGDSGPAGTGAGTNDDTNTTNNVTGVEQADLRPHVHNRWVNPATGQSLEQVELVNRDIQVNAQNQSRFPPVNFCQQGEGNANEASICIGQKEFFPESWSNGEQKIVPPGTSHLEITLEFNADDFSQVAFYYKDRTTTQWQLLTNSSEGNFAPGGDTKELSVSVKQSDDGHAHVSSWNFLVEARGVPGAGNPDDPNAEYGEGTISTTIIAHRVDGELPLEPPHPLFWGNDDPPTSVYQIGDLQGQAEFIQAARMTFEPDSPPPGLQGEGVKGKGVIWQIPVGFEGRRLNAQDTYPPKLGGPFAMSIVPPKSRLLVANVTVNGSVEAGNAPIVCVFGQDIPGKGFRGVRQLGDGCQPFEPGMQFTAELQITNRDTDSFYTNTSTGLSRSRWTFYVQIKANNDGQGVTHWNGSVQADFYVTDQTQFEMPEWALTGSSGGGGGGNATAL